MILKIFEIAATFVMGWLLIARWRKRMKWLRERNIERLGL
jgi:hypothetical protein